MFFGGTLRNNNASNEAFKFNLVTKQLESVPSVPEIKLAHQVIYLPATSIAPKGSVYLFGGKTNAGSRDSTRSGYRFDVASNQWHSLPNSPKDIFSHNLLPILENRFIVLITQPMKLIFDTLYEVWVKDVYDDPFYLYDSDDDIV